VQGQLRSYFVSWVITSAAENPAFFVLDITTEEAQMGTYLMRALKSCSNYGPTMNTMRQIQQAANKAQM